MTHTRLVSTQTAGGAGRTLRRNFNSHKAGPTDGGANPGKECQFSPPVFSELTLREIFSPSRFHVCGLSEKNATRSDKKEEVGAALETTPRPSSLWGIRK